MIIGPRAGAKFPVEAAGSELISEAQFHKPATRIVDAVRILVCGSDTLASHLDQLRALAIPVLTASLLAFLGSYFGKQLLTKVTLRSVQLTVAAAMLVIGAGLAPGIV